MTHLIITVIVLALLFDFLNGIHNSSNVVATMISSRALSPRVALGMTALANFVGPFIFGVAVANTIGHEIVAAECHQHAGPAGRAGQRHLLESADLVPGFSQQFIPCPDRRIHRRGGDRLRVGRPFKLAGLEKILIALFTSPIIGLSGRLY